MCDCFHLAFPNWHAASSGTGGGRRLQGPESATEDDSVCDEPSGFTEGERPRPQGSSPVDECPESEKFDSDEECKAEHDPHHKIGSGKKTKKSGLGSMFEKRSTPKMSKLKEAHSPESEVIVKTAKDGCAEGLVYSGGGKDGIYIKEVVPESPASKSLKLKEGDQLLSATVYFDNVPYEDAIQILEHAQAYKMKLCLKRKPDITQTDEAIESNVIPEEEELKSPEMRKTKRRGDARISWPKFPSLGRGRKNRFIRSHSSSEAEEQRKLELSPTTSDTESPLKSQDALKGKKKHKMKLSVLTKRGRISSSEDQDTDAGTSAQISSDIQQTQESDMLSPEYLEERPQVFVTEHLKLMEDTKIEQNNELQKEAHSPQHKVELISIDSTLKTTDLTVALADPGIKSPDGKKNKKERTELKIKILGKDKSHKKAKSPKRLKTLGASLEVADGPESQKSAKLQGDQTSSDISGQVGMREQKGELDDLTVTQKYPHKEKQQKSKSIKKFKLPRFGSSETPPEETTKKSNDEELTAKNRQLSKDSTEDPYDKLSKMTQLPKREEIEIPGMEDMSKTKTQELKKPKAHSTEQNSEIQSETVPIDVDSVKKAVSKLPGYKLPKVDMSGVPIPEEIIVIDANAQRISVKTPTKVVESRAKHETDYIKFGTIGHYENTKPSFKLPKMRSVDLNTEQLLFETKEPKSSQRDNKTPAYEKENIILPGHQRSHTFDHKSDGIQGQKTIFLQEERISNTQMEKEAKRIGKLVSDIKMPEMEGIEFIDSAEITPTIKDDGIQRMDYNVDTHPNIENSIPDVRSKAEGVLSEWELEIGIKKGEIEEIKGHERNSYTSVKEAVARLSETSVKTEAVAPIGHVESSPDKKLKGEMPEMEIKPVEFKREIDVQYKLPRVGIQIPQIESPKLDISLTQKDEVVQIADSEGKAKYSYAHYTDVTLLGGKVSVTEQQMDKEKPEMTMTPIQREGKVKNEAEGPSFKFQIPTFNLPKLEVGTFSAKTSEERKRKVDGADNEMSEDKSTVTIPEHSINVVGPSIKIKTAEIEQEGKESKFKMPNLGFSMPKLKESKIDVSLPKKATDSPSLEARAEMKLPKVGVELKGPQAEVPEVSESKPDEKGLSKAEGKCEGKGGKFKTPKLGITVPNVYLSSSKKELDATLPEAKAKENDTELTISSAEQDSKAAEFKVVPKDTKESVLKFKIPKFKFPKFVIDPHTISTEGELVTVDNKSPSNKESVDEVKEKNYKLPSLGFKGPEVDLSISKNDVDVTLPKLKAEVNISDAEQEEPVKLEFKATELKVETKDSKESSLNFKMPTNKLPTSGIDTSIAMAQVTDKYEANKVSSKDITIDIKTPIVDTNVPSIDLKMKGSKEERQGSKFTIPHLGLKESTDGILKTDVDVTLPAANVEAEILDDTKVDVNLKLLECDVVSLSKFKMPKLKIPKFVVLTQSLEAEKLDMGKDIQLDGVDITFPGEVLAVSTIDTKAPSLGFKGPDVDLSKPDIDVELPEAKIDVDLPDVGLKKPSTEIKSLEMELSTKDTDGSSSRFKLPTFKMPKFGVGTKGVEAEIPAMETEIKVDGAQITVPEDLLQVNIETPIVDPKMSSTDIKTKGTEHEKEGRKFKLPSLGFKGPVIDLSMTDEGVKQPETKVEVELPDVELKKTSTEIKSPEIKVSTIDMDGSPSRFKMPTFKLPKFGVRTKSLEAEVPDMDTDIKVNYAEITVPKEVLNVDIEAPKFDTKVMSIDEKIEENERKKIGSKFKLPSLGFKGLKMDVPEKDVKVQLPEAEVEVEPPNVELRKTSIEIKSPEMKVSIDDIDGSPSRFMMPTFKIPKFVVKMDVPETDVEVQLPEAEVEVEPPNVELRKTSIEIKSPEMKVSIDDIDGSPSRFKMPTFKLPKFGVRTKSQEAEIPDMDKDIKVSGAEITVPEEVLNVKIEAPTFDTNLVSIDANAKDIEHEKRGSKFKLPSLGFKGPKVDISQTEVEVKLPEAEVEVDLPDIRMNKTSTEIKSPEIKLSKKDTDGSPSRFKLPTFKMPKFGVKTQSLEGEIPDIEMEVDGAEITVPEDVLTVNIETPSVDPNILSTDIKIKEAEQERGGRKFKLPSLGFKGPDVDVKLPDTKVEVELPDVELKKTFTEIKSPEIKVSTLYLDGSPSRFTMPTFKIPKFVVKMDVPETDVEIQLPEAEVEVEPPNVELRKTSIEIKSPEMKVSIDDIDGSPSRFKMPTFKLPKFGVRTKSLEAENPDMDTDIEVSDADITVPQKSLNVNIEAPTFDTNVSIDAKSKDIEHEKRGTKFKLPSLGFKGAKVDLSQTDGEVKLPEATVEVELPDVELKKDGSPSKFKMPTFKLPKFGVRTKSLEAENPDMDTDIKVHGSDITVPEESLNVNIEAQTFDTKVLSIDAKDIEHKKRGSKFKLPNLGFKVPKVDLSQTDVEVKLPEATVEVELPDVELEIPSAERKSPEIKVSTNYLDGSPLRFTMPTFKIPKFVVRAKSLEAENLDMDTDSKVSDADVTVPEESLNVNIETPIFDTNVSIEHEKSTSKFKFPSLGIKGPKVDLSQTDVEVKLPEAAVKVELPDVELKKPSGEVEIKAPGVELYTRDVKELLTKFKLPTLRLPKFGVISPQVSVEESDMDKNIEIKGAELKLEGSKVEVKLPEFEVKGPSSSVSLSDDDAQTKKPGWTMSSFSFSKPSAKAPEAEIILETPKTDLTIPEAKTEINVDIKADRSGSKEDGAAPDLEAKFKKPRFSLPKISFSKPNIKAPEVGVDIQKVDVSLPEVNLEVKQHGFESNQPESKNQVDGHDKNFKLPSIGYKGPGVDFTKPDIDVELPEAKVEVDLPDVELKKTSIEIKSPEIKVSTNDMDGSPSRFKMPTFKLPKFGVRTKSQEAEIPDMDKDIKVSGADITVPEEVLNVKIEAPTFDTNLVSIDAKTKDIEHEKRGGKFKLPSLGFKGPKVDLSQTDVEVKLPEAEVEVDLPDIQLNKTSTEIQSPQMKLSTKDTDGSPSRFKLPTFKMPKFGVKTQSLEAEIPDVDIEIEVDGAEITVPEDVLTVNIETPIVDPNIVSTDIKIKEAEQERGGRKFKLPSLGFKGPDVELSKTDVEKLPDTKVEVELPDFELKKTSTEIKSNEIKAYTNTAEGSPSRFKMPTFKLPKFGVRTKSQEAEIPDMDKDIKVSGADITVPEDVLKVNIEAPTFDTNLSIDAKTKDIEHEKRSSKFKLPSLGFKGPDVDLSITNVDVKLPEAKVEVELPDVELKKPLAEVEIKVPEVALHTSDVEDSPSKFKLPTFRLPKFGTTSPQVSLEEPDRDNNVEIKGADPKLEEAKVEVKLPEFEVKGPSTSVSLSESHAKSKKPGWTMPSFSFSKGSAKAPEAEIIIEAPKTDLTLPEVKTEVNLDIKEDLNISKEDGNALDFEAKIKKPRFSLPKISFSKQNIKAEVDVNLPQVDVSLPEVTAEVRQPDSESLQSGRKIQVDGQENIFTFPSLGFKRPDLDLTKPDIDVEAPEAKVDLDLPDVGLPKTSIEIKSPDIKLPTNESDGSPSRFQLPTFKMPKFGVGNQSLEGEILATETEIKVDGAQVTVPEDLLTVNIETPVVDSNISSTDMKKKGAEHKGGSKKFKLPSLGFKGPDVDLSKTEVDVKLPETKLEVELPDVELKTTTTEIKSPEIKVSTNLDGSPSRFKMPTFKLPKFGVRTKSLEAEIPEIDTDIKVNGAEIIVPEEVLHVPIEAPTFDTNVSIDGKTKDIEHEKKGSKFKLPSLGFKGPDVDLSITNVDLNLPEAKVEVELPDVELKIPSAEMKIKAAEVALHTSDVERSPSKFKLPTFGLPKFDATSSQVNVEEPGIDKNIDTKGVDVKLEGPKVEVKLPEFEVKQPCTSVSLSEGDAQSKKTGWTMPSFSFSKASAKTPDAVITIEAPRTDLTLPDAKIEVDLDIKEHPSVPKDDGTAPHSEAKFKKPRFSLPKISFSKPNIKASEVDVNLPQVDVSLSEVNVEVKQPDFESNQQESKIQDDVQEKTFTLPSLGFKGPDIDLSKPEINVELPEAKIEVDLPDVGLKKPSTEIKSPEMKLSTKDTDGSSSRFKLPTFKMPKFGLETQDIDAEISAMDTQIKVDGAQITGPEDLLTVNIETPIVDPNISSTDIKTKGAEHEKGGRKFKLPSLGFKGPNVDLSKTDVDMKLPEKTVEVELPDAELKKTATEIKSPEIKVSTNDLDGSPSRFKMPTFKLPKFGGRNKSLEAEIPDIDTDIKVTGAEITVQENVLNVNIEAPTFDPNVVSIDEKTKDIEHEKRGSKFKLPSLGFKGPKVDHSQTEVEVKLPEAEVEVDLPDIRLNKTSTEIKSPEIKLSKKDTDGSPSRFKLPTFKMPKFGVKTQSLEAEIPDIEMEVDGAEITVPEDVLTVNIETPIVDPNILSTDIKIKEVEQERGGRKFKLPSLGFKGPDVDVKLPDTKVEVELPDVELKKTSTDIKSPEIEVFTKYLDGSPSRFMMPTFKIPKFVVRTKSLEAENPDIDTDIEISDADITVPEESLNVNIEAPAFDTNISIDAKSKEIEHEKRGSKFKLPSLGFKGAKVDLSQTDVEVKLPEAKVEVELPDVELKKPSAEVEIKAPEVVLHTSDVEDSPSRFKLPTFRLPKFGTTSPQISLEEPDMDKNIEIKGADVKLEEAKVEVKLPEFEVKGPSTSVSLSEGDDKSKKSGWTMSSFSFSKASAKVPEAEIIIEAPKTDLTLPEAKTEVHLDMKDNLKENGAAPDFDAKLKKPRFSLPKISFSKPSTKTPEVDVDLPQVDASLQEVNLEVEQSNIEFDYQEGEIKVDTQVKKLKLPKFVYKGPDIDIPKTDVDRDVDTKYSSSEIKSPGIKIPNKDTDRSPSKFKLPTFKMPTFGVGNQSVEVPEVEREITLDRPDITVKLPSLEFDGLDVDMISPGDKAKVQILEVEMNQPSSEVEIKGLEVRVSADDVTFSQPEILEHEETAASKLPKIEAEGGEGTASEPDSQMVESTAKEKRPGWTFPKFSFSKTSEKSPNAAVNIETSKLDDTFSDANTEAYQQDAEKIETEKKLSEVEMGHEKQATFKLPKISVGKRKLSEKGEDFTVEAKANLPKSDVKEESSNTETKTVKTESKSKDVRGSPQKFKMPSLKMPQFSSGAHEDTAEATSTEKGPKTDKMTPKTEVTVTNKEQSFDTRSGVLKEEISEIKMSKDGRDGVSPGSPSKFNLSLFKMPKLGFSRAKSEDEHVQADTEEKQDPLKVQIQPKEDSKSPKSDSFGKMFDTIDVEFNVPKVEKVEDGNQLVGNVEPTKSPEKTGWFRFPKLSLSSPTEAVKQTEKIQQKEISPAGETGDEEISPISSVESSDAFADISSTVTSEPVVPSLSSPTKVTVKYTDQSPGVTGNEEMMSNIISSTARTELFSEVPDLPEKITILSSEASSSSEDTLRLKSSRIHVISSNIQATPEAERARLLTAVQIQSAEGLPQTSDVSWRVEDSEGNKRTVFEKHVLTKTSEETSESKETIVITKQITRVFESSDAASSIQRLRDSVHSEKMRFFDEAEK